MFYRRKVILALLQEFGGELPKISLQKLLFLFTLRQDKPEYNFVPFLYGCYSFSANADLKAMVRHEQLAENEKSFSMVGSTDYAKMLNGGDQKILTEIKNSYGKLTTGSLMKLTYLNHHYYAINSIKAREVLNEEQYERVLNAKPVNKGTILYTIGYEGISLEEYLNRLIKNDVKVLVDVRNNPQSMKYGFSKKQLSNFCNSLNIEYLHIPEVGIQSQQRRQLKTQADYDNLFQTYKEQNLSGTISHQQQILDLLKEKKRIALTCFEANICQCHRKHLAEAIQGLPDWQYEVKHI